ncbi:Putative F-box domain-containing protein [Septoria linicola]|uniref:F-box domain-containing protein n=1 Tax=Septoria linicola TaxID=215465 RepID=A0A9Q9AYW5_9PEZI|nr:putative F-box domain-containing protein [Septoria linicola]USW55060.1 Putative F-box domain-containing protein [Septoria linicola]
MALKRKACDSFEQQPNKKITTSSLSIARGILSSVGALLKHNPSTSPNAVCDEGTGQKKNTDPSAMTMSTGLKLKTMSRGGLKCNAPPQHVSGPANKKASRKAKSVAHTMITRRITKLQAFNAVFNTGELLEQILCFLPPEAIIKLRRVNKNWNHIILTLPTLRQKIFLQAQPLGGFWVYDTVGRHLHPYIDGMSRAYGDSWQNRQTFCRPVQLNTMLFKRDDRAERVPIFHRAMICESLRLAARPDLLKRTRCIYHEMFVTQPPVTTVEFTIFWHDRNLRRQGYHSPTRSTRLKVVRHGGVRFRDILVTFLKDVTHPNIYKAVQNNMMPAPDYCIRVGGNTRKKTTIWTLGGIFVSEAERAMVEKLRETPPLRMGLSAPSLMTLSPQAMELIKANNDRKIDFRALEKSFTGNLWGN